jgi:hypothetical protein
MSTALDRTTTTPSTPSSGPTRPTGRGWVLAGLGAGVLAIAGLVGSSMVNAIYDPEIQGDAAAITDRLSEQVPQILAFHTATMVSCVLLVLFAVGLHRQLVRLVGPESLLPGVAAAGLGLVAVAQLLGAGLTTEFVFAVTENDMVIPESATFFNHWIGTIPWLWGGAGLTGLAVAAAARRGAYPRWLGWTSLVLGGLSALFLVSPVQYMAGMTGPVWLVVVSLGLLKPAREA